MYLLPHGGSRHLRLILLNRQTKQNRYETMNDHIYETHARITALRSIVAFIIHTLPEEQKGPLLRAIEIISEEKLMDNFDFSHTSDVTSETIEKMNAAYANVFKEVLNFSSQDVEPEQEKYLQ